MISTPTTYWLVTLILPILVFKKLSKNFLKTFCLDIFFESVLEIFFLPKLSPGIIIFFNFSNLLVVDVIVLGVLSLWFESPISPFSSFSCILFSISGVSLLSVFCNCKSSNHFSNITIAFSKSVVPDEIIFCLPFIYVLPTQL